MVIGIEETTPEPWWRVGSTFPDTLDNLQELDTDSLPDSDPDVACRCADCLSCYWARTSRLQGLTSSKPGLLDFLKTKLFCWWLNGNSRHELFFCWKHSGKNKLKLFSYRFLLSCKINKLRLTFTRFSRNRHLVGLHHVQVILQSRTPATGRDDSGRSDVDRDVEVDVDIKTVVERRSTWSEICEREKCFCLFINKVLRGFFNLKEAEFGF